MDIVHRRQRKIYIIIGVILLAIGVLTFISVDLMNSGKIEVLISDFSVFVFSLTALLNGFYGKSGYKGLLLILVSVLIGLLGWSIYMAGDLMGSLAVFWGGTPAGIITGVIFCDHQSFYAAQQDQNKVVMETNCLLLLSLERKGK